MSSTSFWTCPSSTMNRLRKNAISILLWRNWFCNLLTWLSMETVFERACSSKIRSKSHRRVFAWLIQGEIPLSLVSFKFLWREMVRVVLFCKFGHIFALLFCPSDCELWFTIDLFSEKAILNTCKMFTLRVDFLTASLPRIPSHVLLFFSSVLPCWAPWVGPFFIT